MKLPIEEQLKTLKQMPLSDQEKNALWSTVAASLPPQKSTSWFIQTFIIISKHSMASIIIALIVLLSGSVATVAAADNANPGDLLYPLDRSIERVQLRLATSDEKRTELEVSFAEERVHEAEEVIKDETHHGDDSDSSTDDDSNDTINDDGGVATSTVATSSVVVSEKSKVRIQNALQEAEDYLNALQQRLRDAGDDAAADTVEAIRLRLESQAATIPAGIKLEIHADDDGLEIEYEDERDDDSSKNRTQNEVRIREQSDDNENDDSHRSVENETRQRVESHESTSSKSDDSSTHDGEGDDDSSSHSTGLTEVEMHVVGSQATVQVEYNDQKHTYQFDVTDLDTITAHIATDLGISETDVRDMIRIEYDDTSHDDSDKDSDSSNDATQADATIKEIEVDIKSGDGKAEIKVEFTNDTKEEYLLNTTLESAIKTEIMARYGITSEVFDGMVSFDR